MIINNTNVTTTIASVSFIISGIATIVTKFFKFLPEEITIPLRKFAAPAFIVSMGFLAGSLLESMYNNIATPITLAGYVLAAVLIWNTSSKKQTGTSDKTFPLALVMVSTACIVIFSIVIGVSLEYYDNYTTFIFGVTGSILAAVNIVATVWADRHNQATERTEK